MKKIILAVLLVSFAFYGNAQEKIHLYIQGEAGPAIAKIVKEYGERATFTLAGDIEFGLKSNNFIVAIGDQFIPLPRLVAPFVRIGTNYLKNDKDIFFGNYIAAGFFTEHNQLFKKNILYFSHIKAGFYFSRKSLTLTLNVNNYISENILYRIVSVNLEIGYCFNIGKQKEKIK